MVFIFFFGDTDVSLTFINHSPIEKIIVIDIKEGTKKPYGWKGIYYARDGSINKKLKPTEISDINLASKGLTFDGLKCMMYGRDATIGDLDEQKIKEYIMKFNSSKRNKKMKYTTIKNFLCNCDLCLNHNFKNTSILFFGKKPQDCFQNSKINFLIYSGDVEDSTKLKYKKLIQGDLIYQIDGSVELIKSYTDNKVVMDGLRRIEINQYPLEAIREAVINAIAHRDYSIFESFINIRLFDNRLEIINPGALMEGITIEEIKQGGLSKRRNLNICSILDNIGFMEQSGQGIKNIILALKKVGLREPLIEEKDDFFKIEFYGQSTNLSTNTRAIGVETDLSKELTELQKKRIKLYSRVYGGGNYNKEIYGVCNFFSYNC